MRHPLNHSLSALLVGGALAGIFGAGPATHLAADALPSLEDVRQEYDAAKYKDVVRDVSHITTSRAWQAKKTDAFDLFTLKAEAHLRLKENLLAATTFETAAKSTADPAQAGVARATAYLIKHSTGPNYVPRATINKRAPGQRADDHLKINIVEPDSRKTAFDALWTDEKAADAEKTEAATATDNKSIQDVLAAAPLVAHLRDFDLAAHGNDDESRQLAQNIAEHGRDLLTAMVDKIAVRVDVISGRALAIEQIQMAYHNTNTWHRHGMENMEPKELADAVTNTDKVAAAAKILADELNPDADFFTPMTKEAKRVHDKAVKTLKADYGEVFYTWAAAKLAK